MEVANFEISEPRITFIVEHGSDETQAKGEVNIYNLRPQNAQRIEQRGGPIRIFSGYGDNIDLVFQGHVQRVIRARENLSFITRIELGDQVRTRTVLGGVYMKTYDGPVNTRQIAREIIEDGFKLGENGEPMRAGPLDAIPAGHTTTDFQAIGSVASANLIQLLRGVAGQRLSFYVDGNVVRIKNESDPQMDNRTHEISPDTGLIDRPIATDEGAEIRMFFNGRVNLGDLLNISLPGGDTESQSLAGLYKVDMVRHTMDNWEVKRGETFCDCRRLGTADPGDVGL